MFVQSPFYRDIEPSPIESLSNNLTIALLSIGINHESLQDPIAKKLWTYLERCARAAHAVPSSLDASTSAEFEDAVEVAQLAISILGFLDAAAKYANFWTARERIILIEQVRRVLSESFLVSVETAFSTIRTSRSQDSYAKEWRRYYRHYAAIGRPLGAMLLQRSYMWLLVASSSLLIAETEVLRGGDILDILMEANAEERPGTASSGDTSLTMLETMAEIASDEMSLLEDGADYLRLGSTWQQRLAFAVKAAALTSYMNCVILNEDAADPDTLLTWLEATLLDPAQMADELLASVVLRCLALLAKVSSSLAPNMVRMLPRFIVQGSPSHTTLNTASKCLAYVLKLLSPDALISTLYTLGNVIATGPVIDKAMGLSMNGDIVNGNAAAFYGNKHANGSSISLTTASDEDNTAAYDNIIRAVCLIASSFHDEKIAALAQSMLLQKVTKVSKAVDVRIIIETSVLSLSGSSLEFKSLLKLHDRITDHGITHNDEAILHAVSHP